MIKESENILHTIFGKTITDKAELDMIISAFYRTTVKKNEFVLKEGQQAKEYHFVQSGLLRSYVIDTKGNDVTTNFHYKGEVMWDASSLFLRKPSQESMQALEDSELWGISFESSDVLFNRLASFRASGRGRLVANNLRLKQRSLSMIVDSAETRYLHLMQEQPEIVKLAPLKHIATFLGITNTSLSRIRKEISSR